MKQKVTVKGEGKRLRVPGIPEFIVAVDNKASDTESPHFEDVAGVEVPRDVPGGVGMTPMEEVEMEEEEEEDPDVHFKQKQKGKRNLATTLPSLQRANWLRSSLLLPH